MIILFRFSENSSHNMMYFVLLDFVVHPMCGVLCTLFVSLLMQALEVVDSYFITINFPFRQNYQFQGMICN